VRPLNEMDWAIAELAVIDPGLDVTVYKVMADPLLDGALNTTAAAPLACPTVATTPVGGLGTVAGITTADADEDTLVPRALVAVTVNV